MGRIAALAVLLSIFTLQSADAARILVVDDSVTIGRVVSQYLKALGHDDVVVVENAAEGLKALAGPPPIDLAVVDLKMLGGDGVGFIRGARSGDGRDLPILVMGIAADRDAMDDAIDAGADRAIVKPFTRDALKSELDALLNR